MKTDGNQEAQINALKGFIGHLHKELKVFKIFANTFAVSTLFMCIVAAVIMMKRGCH